jgi:uncharacterized protein
MAGFDLFRRMYDFFSRHRLILFAASAACIIASILLLRSIRLSEDIKSMLPDNQADFTVDFDLLQHTPFMHKIIINLKDKFGGDIKQTIEAADRLAGAMTRPYFTRVLSGPAIDQGSDIYNRLIKALPDLANEKDLAELKSSLTPQHIKDQLTEDYNSLFSPEGWYLKNFIKTDPLNLKIIGLKKLAFLNIIPNVRLQDNHFIDAEGKNVLLIAETDVDVTDTGNSEKMLAQLDGLVASIVPQNIEVSVLSAHSYTVANAQTIKKDLFVVLTISSLSVIILYLLFMRNWRTAFVLLISFASFAIALASLSLIYKAVSAITIGFGSALLGLYDEFCLLVYFALRPGKSTDRPGDLSKVMADVSRPVMFGGLITLGVFALLMFSALPGQRQLGAFTILGVTASLAMALILLPQMMHGASRGKDLPGVIFRKRPASRPWLVIGLWALFLAACAWEGRHITINGDLNSINYVPGELRSNELMVKNTWGNVRGSAMIFSEGKDLESALRTNDALFSCLSQNTGGKEILSIAPILPSQKTQQINRDAWKTFWSENKQPVCTTLAKEGKALGFSANAFESFCSGLKATAASVSLADLNIFGVKDVLDSMIIHSEGKVSILTMVPDTAEVKAVATQCKERSPGIRFVSQTHFSEMIRNAIGHDFVRFIIGAFVLIVLMLIILFRDTKKVLLSLVPVVTGMVFMFGVMSMLKISFNIFNIISSIVVIGEGVDFGIFMVTRSSGDYSHDTDTTVLLSGFTSITGFGALIFARHPALHSIGLTVLLGIVAAIPAALYVIPAFYGKKKLSREGIDL